MNNIRTNIKNKNKNQLNFVSILLIIASVISLSPVFLTVPIFKGNIISLLCLIAIIFFTKINLSKQGIFAIIILFLFSIINILYWGSFTIKAGIYFYTILLIVFLLSKNDVFKFTEYLSKFLAIMLIGGFIGFIYALAGGEPLFTFANEDSRPNYFYLTTFSNSYNTGGIIRPSGIFDEPGALSFLICICVALRENLQMARKTSWFLLITGFITLSTAHAIFFLFFWIGTQWISLKSFFISLLIGCSVLLFFSSFDNPVLVIIEYVFNRFMIVDGSFVGDNRSGLIINSYNYLDLKTFLFGLDGNCIAGTPLCNPSQNLGYCCNPLTPLVHYGIFLSLPYYISMAYLLLKSIKHKDLIIFGVFLLLLQRPYIMAYGYAIMLLIYIYSLKFTNKNSVITPKLSK